MAAKLNTIKGFECECTGETAPALHSHFYLLQSYSLGRIPLPTARLRFLLSVNLLAPYIIRIQVTPAGTLSACTRIS